MEKRNILKRIEKLYANENKNIIRYLKDISGQEQNTIEDIMISYDFQAGTYIDHYEQDPGYYDRLVARLAEVIDGLDCPKRSLFECGVGEATVFATLMNRIEARPVFSGGVDISWSRIKTAQGFAAKHLQNGAATLVVGDMFRLPLLDSSVDIVYTRQAVEPNGGHEKEILQELFRVTNEYLILIEPSYENAGEKARRRMEYHGYVRNLYSTAQNLGFDIEAYEPYDVPDDETNQMNPLYIMVIRKGAGKNVKNPLCCPVTRTPIKKIGNAYFSSESLLAYPIVNGVPYLIADGAIVATKMEEME